MKKCNALLVSMIMIVVGIIAIPQQATAEAGNYYYHFDECKCWYEGNAGAVCDPENAEMGLWTECRCGGEAGCFGLTYMDQPSPSLPRFAGIKVHIEGYASEGPHEHLRLTYCWEEGKVIKDFYGTEMNGWVDFTWTYVTELHRIPHIQSLQAELFGPPCCCTNKLEIQTVFYLGSDIPHW